MYKLCLPSYTLNCKKIEGVINIFDICRKKYVKLTPEEWVRQNFIHYLIHDKKFPQSLIAVEQSLDVYNLPKRADVVCYDTTGAIKVLVECKAPQIKISQQVFEQIAAYNITLQAPFLIVTNGLQHFYCKIDFATKSYTFFEELPEFNKLIV